MNRVLTFLAFLLLLAAALGFATALIGLFLSLVLTTFWGAL